jgi:hypothetical protein
MCLSSFALTHHASAENLGKPTAPILPETAFILLCKFGSGDFRSSKNFTVDTYEQTVDELPAKFTDTMIIFDRETNGSTLHYEINRLDGGFIQKCGFPCKKHGMPILPGKELTGKCTRAPSDRLF